MTADEMRAGLEHELAWRQEDLAFFKNQLNHIVGDDKKDCYRKSLVLILYSHLEGYIKISLRTYIQHLNSLDLQRNDVNANLQVSGMHQEFNAYDILDRKCNIFRKALPNDTRLHRFYRRVDLMESIDRFKQDKLVLDDLIIDTESNLWYVVLQKNLYKIGLPIDLFDDYGRYIDALVNRRNSIAHGNLRAGVSEQEYEGWLTKAYEVMNGTMKSLHHYAKNKSYLC